MKKLLTLLIITCTIMVADAQTSGIDTYRKVSTKGYSEREVTPDIIYLAINLKEFYIDGNAKKKVFIETLEKQLYNTALANGVKKEDFVIQNIYSYSHDVKKKPSELLQARQYRLKITDLSRLNAILEKIDPYGIESTSISGYDHSQKREIERELKTEAVKDARRNAEILAAADGQSLGKVLVINDNTNINFNDLIPVQRMAFSRSSVGQESADLNESLNISVRPIKLTSYVDGVFELK